MLKHTIDSIRGFRKIPKKPISSKVNDDIYSKLDQDAKATNMTVSKKVNRILTDHYTKTQQKTFDDVWTTQPMRLYCPLYGWLDFEGLLKECQTCPHRLGSARTKCSMWHSGKGYNTQYHDPPAKIKHRR